MRRTVAVILSTILAAGVFGCATKKVAERPDYDRIREGAREASDDLSDEERKKKARDSDQE